MNSSLFNPYRMKLFFSLLTLLTVCVPFYPGNCEKNLGIVKIVVNKVFGNTILKTLPHGYSISKNQRIRTSLDSSAEIQLLDDSKIYIGELSDLRFNLLPSKNNAETNFPKIHINKGVMRYNSIKFSNQNLEILTPHAVFGVSGGSLDVIVNTSGTELTVHQGAVKIKSSSTSEFVSSGQNFRIAPSGDVVFEQASSERMKASVSDMISQIKFKEGEIPRPDSKIEQRNDKENISLLYSPNEKLGIAGRNLENILYMDLSYGRVIIEMMPTVAPKHVERIRQLVKEKFYDGLKFHNVVDGFVAETGDPTGTGLGGTGTMLNAELSEIPFKRGVVGMKHDQNNINSADSQFFILLGDAKHLEGNYTAWGRVIHGMLLMDRMRKGSPPENPDFIVKLSLAADL